MIVWTYDGPIEMTNYEYYCYKYGKETVDKWLKEVTMKDLMECMYAFSNDTFVKFVKDHGHLHHRDKDLNILEMILQETPEGLYRTVTYGVCPGAICTDAIGYLTGRKNGNVDIAIFLIEEKISVLKAWLLANHKFTKREKRLLHYKIE